MKIYNSNNVVYSPTVEDMEFIKKIGLKARKKIQVQLLRNEIYIDTEQLLYSLQKEKIKFDINQLEVESYFVSLIDSLSLTKSGVILKKKKKVDEAGNIITTPVVTMSMDQIRTPKSSEYKQLYEGWKRIPSMKSLEIVIHDYNIKLAEIGFKKRLPTELRFIGTSNESMNKYMAYEIRGLKKLVRNGSFSKYGKRVNYLLRNSVAFRVSAFNRVLPNWGHSLSLDKVAAISKRVNEIIGHLESDLEISRHYLPKGETFRPLGVPKPEGRVVMHMMANFFVTLLKPEIVKYNHGFIPGHGTGTALTEFIERLRVSNYIYEFDFKQFFPSVTPAVVSKKLKDILKMPPELHTWISKINLTIPEIPEEVKLQEDSDLLLFEEEMDFALGDSVYEEDPSFDGDPESEILAEQQAHHDSILSESLGLPQGLNTSPVLSIYSIKDGASTYIKKKVKPVMYADDGSLCSKKKFIPVPPDGHKFHPDKSRGVKYNGKFVVDSMVFLGVEFNFKTMEISGHTRNGSRLKFDLRARNLLDLIQELCTGYNNDFAKDKLENASKSGLGGFIMSKLYNNSWDLAEYEVKKGRQHKNSGGVKTYNGKFYNVLKRDKVKHRGLSSIAVNTLIEIVSDSMAELMYEKKRRSK